MKLYSAHLKPDAEPVLVRDGFSFGALILGPFWLAAHRAWVAAALSLAAFVFILVLAPVPVSAVLAVGLAVILGLTGRDLYAMALAQRGFVLVHVIAARGLDDAWLRLMTQRPDLMARFRPEIA